MSLFPFDTATLTNLTAAGVTSSVGVKASAVTFQVTVSGVGTNVVVRFEGSLDNTNFFNLDDGNQDTTITEDGTSGYALNGCPVKFIRLRLVSVSGGSPTVVTRVSST
tara:strand:+ start:719 stop:1042 length:324 start_codon:yes stop_codon:yes gene_type:complete